ncbi:MAG TPA: glycogen synthase GlgA [Firmicutes bacterium]|nr:glycogen synthase GlgA [Bacillota bacterium]
MKVLFVVAEAVPFAKTGGLADVAGSLPAALRNFGADAGVIMPAYGCIAPEYKMKMKRLCKVTVSMGWRYQYCELKMLEHQGVPYYFIDNEYYFSRNGIYGFYDDAERFAFFSRAVLQSLPCLDAAPQILHCHDWHTGPVSVFLNTHFRQDPFYRDIKTIFSIHNLLYQGNFHREILSDIMELDEEHFTASGIEFYGQVSYLKGGLVFSDYLTTVSPAYALEIQSPHHGYGMEGLLQQRSTQLTGIINGIDQAAYNPATDPHIFVNYRNSLHKKRQNKLMLQEKLGLAVDGAIPLFAFINRLVEQKGLDLIMQALDELLTMRIQMIFLGTGEEHYVRYLTEMAARYPGQLSFNNNFNESLARKIYAGADIFLLPALFEPCGIGQLIAMRYGTIPLVRKTGGLKDTVQDYDETTGVGNGFNFSHYNADDMVIAIRKALSVYRDKRRWEALVGSALREDHGWDIPARQYLELYRQLAGQRGVSG